ncbi:hypothetical protein LEP3755_13590 [Leptolyngbya sp. NIES-3755]|nr:hypothetical protein LEP3755_13590 [Leptolyngbya sp. NIES-3755]
MLQVEVKKTIRTRLKIQSIQQNTTMGELTERILDEALSKLERGTE